MSSLVDSRWVGSIHCRHRSIVLVSEYTYIYIYIIRRPEFRRTYDDDDRLHTEYYHCTLHTHTHKHTVIYTFVYVCMYKYVVSADGWRRKTGTTNVELSRVYIHNNTIYIYVFIYFMKL